MTSKIDDGSSYDLCKIQDDFSVTKGNLRLLFENMMDGFSYHKMVVDSEGKPIDYVFLEINRAFEEQTGLKRENLIGKTVLEVLPTTESYWIEIYGRVASTGVPEKFESYSVGLCKWYAVSAYSPQVNHFAVISRDITARKKAEETVKEVNLELESKVAERTMQLMDLNSELEESNAELEELNAMFEEEITRRQKAEEDLTKLNEELEKKVIERTSQLQDMNSILEEEIIEKTRAENERNLLNERLQKYQVLAEKTNDVMLFIDIEGNILEVNEAATRIYGYTYKEFLSMTIFDLRHTSKSSNTIDQMKLADKEGIVFETVHFLKDGTFINVEVSSQGTYLENKRVLLSIVRDITQRKLTEVKLKESEEKFKEIAENLGEVIWVRQDGQLVYVSPTYEKVWGRTSQSLYDNPDSFIESIHPDDKERITQTYLEENDLSNCQFDDQYRIIWTDGTIRWIWSRKYPIYDQNGKVIRLLGISDDITKIKETEESLILAMETAETANKAKSQFLANMSHEIRTPMNGILGMAQLLIMNLQDEQKGMAMIIKTSGDNLLKIIDDILDISQIEVGKVRLSQDKFDIKMLVNEVDNLLNPLIIRKGLEYKSYIDHQITAQIIGDSGRLKQIIINLLGNAIKFTERGSIELSIVRGKVFQDRVQIIFSIKDTGIGIADDKIGQLFTYFTQGDDSVTKKYGGTGLGLAISKQLINMMDGEISVESKLGVGSNFSFNAIFVLTTEEIELKTAIDGDATAMTSLDSTALLVEDDYVSGVVMKKLCERKNINLKIASSGKEALDILEGESFDIIFMDIQMPDISGYETTKIFRAMEKTLSRYTPIIATTAFASVGDREKCIDAGMDDYLGKPISAEKLYFLLDKYVNKR